MKGLDQWLTSDPSMDYDVIEEAEKVLKSYQYAKLNWESSPGNWSHHLEAMKVMIEELMDYIEANI